MSRLTPFPVADSVAAATAKLTKGLPRAENTLQTRTPLFHHVAYPAAGTTAQVDFFQVGSQPFISNFPGTGGQLPANYTFSLLSVGLGLITGIDITGARVAASNQSNASATDALTVAEQYRTIIEAPVDLALYVGEKEIARASCLAQWPLGFGAFAGGGVGPATGSNVIMSTGVPTHDNKFRIGPDPHPILPGQAVRVSLRFQAALTMAGAGILRCVLDGFLSRPAGT